MIQPPTAVLQVEGAVVPMRCQIQEDRLVAVHQKSHTSASTSCSKLLAKEISPK